MEQLEREVEGYLKKRVKELGGKTYKLRFLNCVGATDRLVGVYGKLCFVEVKSPTGATRPTQHLRHAELRSFGAIVCTVSSFSEVDALLGQLRYG